MHAAWNNNSFADAHLWHAVIKVVQMTRSNTDQVSKTVTAASTTGLKPAAMTQHPGKLHKLCSLQRPRGLPRDKLVTNLCSNQSRRSITFLQSQLHKTVTGCHRHCTCMRLSGSPQRHHDVKAQAVTCLNRVYISHISVVVASVLAILVLVS